MHIIIVNIIIISNVIITIIIINIILIIIIIIIIIFLNCKSNIFKVSHAFVHFWNIFIKMMIVL